MLSRLPLVPKTECSSYLESEDNYFCLSSQSELNYPQKLLPCSRIREITTNCVVCSLPNYLQEVFAEVLDTLLLFTPFIYVLVVSTIWWNSSSESSGIQEEIFIIKSLVWKHTWVGRPWLLTWKRRFSRTLNRNSGDIRRFGRVQNWHSHKDADASIKFI